MTTMSDWLAVHRELIQAELRLTEAAMNLSTATISLAQFDTLKQDVEAIRARANAVLEQALRDTAAAARLPPAGP